MPRDTKKVLVTGNAGAGKTTLAQALAKSLDVQCHSLDGVVWQERWHKTPQAQKDAQIEEIISAETWVIDGVSERVMQAADIVVFLDVPRSVSALRVMRRNLRYLFKSRPGLPPHCPEILVIPKLARLIWRFPRNVRPMIVRHGRDRADKTFLHVSWPHTGRHILDSPDAK